MKQIALMTALFAFICSAATATMRTQFTSGIQDREPIDRLEVIQRTEDGRIIFFSEIVDQNGNNIYHVWKSGDKEIYRHKFSVGSDKWRVSSSTSQLHFPNDGMILVEIQDDDDQVLESYSIEIK